MTVVYILLFGLLLLLGLILRTQADSARSETSSIDHRVSQEWEDAFELIASHRGEVAFHLDPLSGSMTYSADPGPQLLGYTENHLPTGFNLLRRLIHPSEQTALKEIWERLRGGEELDTSLRLIRPDGSYCWVQLIAIPAKNHGMIGILRNIQDLHKERDAIEENRRMQTITTMAGGLAHEFNNHLTPVTGFIELALDYLGDEHPVSEGLQTAMTRALYCTELVSQIQSFGRHQVLKKEAIDLDRFLPVAMNVAMSGDSNSGSDVEVVRDWESPLPSIFGDPNRLREAFTQLVRNALEAMPGRGTLTVRAGIRSHLGQEGKITDDEHIFIQIADTGMGISPENREQIFDPFFSTRTDRAGRGMGLPMVQGIIAQHEGWLEIHSEMNMGTVVNVYLPRHSASVASAFPNEDDTLSVLPAATAGRMLVADDEEAICRLIEKTFEADGWNVETMHDYYAVLRKVVTDKTPYDLLILDITMPGPSADESLEAILKAQPNIPVLLISGFSRDDRIETLIGQTKAHFLGKPFTTHAIIASVDKILSERISH